jgi:hypothetical protein
MTSTLELSPAFTPLAGGVLTTIVPTEVNKPEFVATLRAAAPIWALLSQARTAGISRNVRGVLQLALREIPIPGLRSQTQASDHNGKDDRDDDGSRAALVRVQVADAGQQPTRQGSRRSSLGSRVFNERSHEISSIVVVPGIPCPESLGRMGNLDRRRSDDHGEEHGQKKQNHRNGEFRR